MTSHLSNLLIRPNNLVCVTASSLQSRLSLRFYQNPVTQKWFISQLYG